MKLMSIGSDDLQGGTLMAHFVLFISRIVNIAPYRYLMQKCMIATVQLSNRLTLASFEINIWSRQREGLG